MRKFASNKNVLILAFTLVVVMLGYGLVIPIIPFYMDEMGAGGTELGLLVASYAFMRLIFGPIWGSISDRHGRKSVLMVGVFGYAVAMFFFGLANQLWMVFAARILSGILSSATAPTTLAYISDSTSEEERGGGMGILGAAVGLGTILGPGLGGLVSGESLALPFFIASGMSLVAVALIYFLLPESLPVEKRQSTVGLTGGFSFKRLHLVLTGSIGLLMILAFLVTCGVTTFYSVFGLYALEQFGYGPQEVGGILMLMGLVSAVGQGALSGPSTRRWGEAVVIKVGLLGGAIAYLLLVPATNLIPFLVMIAFFILATAVLTPALTALTSKYAPLEQGITMGVSNSFMSLGRIVGPLVGGFVFDLNLIYPFLAGAAVFFAGFGLSLVGLRERRVEPIPASVQPPGK